MTDWYAVGVGFVVELVVGVVGLAIPGVGQIGAGFVGGFAAGYLAGGGIGRGAWHGLLAGAIGGVVLAVLLGVAVSVLGLAAGPLGPLLGLGAFGLALVVAVLLALDSGLAGAVGGWVKGL